MASFNKIFLRGLITLLPIAITIYILYSAIIILENLLGSVLRMLIPIYIPGLGLLLTLLLIFAFGLMLNNLLTGRVWETIEHRLIKVPFIKAIYSPLRDLMNLFSEKHAGTMKGVVLVNIGDSGAKALGIVTREKFEDLPLADNQNQYVAVYFPLSYGLGGFTFMVPKQNVTPLDIPVERAMSLAITGWVKTDAKNEVKPETIKRENT